VGDEVSHVFWKRFRKAIKEVKEDAIIIGEIWHYAGDFLEGDEWDSVMNYPFLQAVVDFVAAGNTTPSQFLGDLGFLRGNLHPDSHKCLLNLIDSHDTSRFMHLCKNKKKKHKLGAALQILSPGMPMIYYGDEFGMEGAHDPDCRRGMLWDEERQDKKMFEWYCNLIKIRKEHSCVTDGDMISNESDDDRGLLIFTKKYEDDELTFIYHNNNETVEIDSHIGEMNLINGKKFDGSIKGYDVIVLKK
jgi:glycosidase